MKKRFIALTIAAMMMILLLAGCNTASTTPGTGSTQPPADTTNPPDDNTDPETTPEDTDPVDEVEPRTTRDLGGTTIQFANWWSNSDDLITKEDKTRLEEATLDARNQIQTDNNVTVRNVSMGSWGDIQELAAQQIMAAAPEYDTYTLDSGWVYAFISRALMFDVSSLPSYKEALAYDPTKWNMLVADLMTFGDKTYGFATGYEPRTGVFFNKRLLEEAGIDPNEPYNHQAAGTWTWEVFEEMCRKTTRDIDQNGEMDTYAITTFSSDYVAGFVFSNDAQFVGKNDDGTVYNAIHEPNFLEAIQFCQKLVTEGFIQPKPDPDLDWNWFEAAFNEGKAAFRIAEEYCKSGIGEGLDDEFGFVMVPRGPKGTGQVLYRENVLFIPYCLDAQRADDVFFIYDRWTDPVPGYEDDDSWKIGAYAAYDDERAVDETLEIMRAGENGILRNECLVGFSNDAFGNLVWNIWADEDGTMGINYTPQELVDSVTVDWDSQIASANAKLSTLK